MNDTKKQTTYTKFDGDWKLAATLFPSGKVKSAETDRIACATLLFIRDEARAQTAIMKEQTRILRAISRKLAKPRKRKIIK